MFDKAELKIEYCKEDMQTLRGMWDEIFDDPKGFADYYFDEVCTDNVILVAYYRDNLIGMLHLNHYNISVYGTENRCYYIVGVAVKLDMRRQGIMKLMLQKALDDMREEGCMLTFLMPEKQEYYLSLGFEQIYSTSIVEYDIAKLSVLANTNTLRLEMIDTYNYNELGILAENINNILAENYKVFALRDVKYLDRMIKEHLCQNGNVCAIYDIDKCIEGMFSYDIYENIMYVERFEPLGDNLRELIVCVLKFASDKSCSKCIITVPEMSRQYATKYPENDLNFGETMIQCSEGHGIMALILGNSSAISIDSLKKNSFFDEIV